MLELVATENLFHLRRVGPNIDLQAEPVLKANLVWAFLGADAFKDRSKDLLMVLEGEIAHETKGALSDGDARWHLSRVEILGCIKQRTVATKRDNVVDLFLVFGRENCSDLLL